ncbi:MAG: hypothetical protein HGA96_08545 [Desulfobulbaceae bacterium]|nr:hypothetical protein [Desulfobulbaceae bacterium]
MKQSISLMALSMAALSTAILTGPITNAQAADAVAVEKSPAVELKTGPTFNAVAYIAGHGGHLAIIDLRTLKPPVDVVKDRIVLTEAGSEMEGKIAGMDFEKVKKSGGSHGQVLTHEGDKKYLVAGTLGGDVYKIDMATGKKEGPVKVGEKFCGAIKGPNGNIYFEDMANGKVYEFDSVKMKTVDAMPAGMAVCGIQWTKNNKTAYITDMPAGKVYVYDWATKKKTKEITSPEMTFIHQARMTPDGKELWVSAPNEYDAGLKPATHRSQVIIIDTEKNEIVKRVLMPKGISPHDFAFSADGKYAFLSSRTYGNDSVLNIVERKDFTMVSQVSACYGCHKANEVEVEMDNASPLLCGIEIDWNPPAAK